MNGRRRSTSRNDPTRRHRISSAAVIRTPRKEWELCSYAAVKADPEFHFLAENPFVLGSYLRASSVMQAAKFTAFSSTNETANVWTHLFGAVCIAYLSFYTYFNSDKLIDPELGPLIETSPSSAANTSAGGVMSQPVPSRPTAALWPVWTYLLACFTCFTASTANHLLHSVSRRLASSLARVDFLGIALLITGASIAPVWYGFAACSPWLATTYLSLMAAAFVAVAVTTTMSRFGSGEHRTLRICAYAALALVCGIPQAHLAVVHYGASADDHDPHLGLVHFWLHSMLALNTIGVILYTFRIPERWWPGSFDLFPSHAFFHCFIDLASIAMYLAAIEHYRWRSMHLEDCPAREGEGEGAMQFGGAMLSGVSTVMESIGSNNWTLESSLQGTLQQMLTGQRGS
jgi:adiponectin receptor